MTPRLGRWHIAAAMLILAILAAASLLPPQPLPHYKDYPLGAVPKTVRPQR